MFLYILGGSDGTNYNGDVLKFDIVKLVWIKVAKITPARDFHAVSVVRLPDVEKLCLKNP